MNKDLHCTGRSCKLSLQLSGNIVNSLPFLIQRYYISKLRSQLNIHLLIKLAKYIYIYIYIYKLHWYELWTFG